jgi:hypothetical protein
MSNEKPPKAVTDWMAQIGRKGGESKGPKKARPVAHYKAAAAKRWAKVRKAKAKAVKEKP